MIASGCWFVGLVAMSCLVVYCCLLSSLVCFWRFLTFDGCCFIVNLLFGFLAGVVICDCCGALFNSVVVVY